MKHLPTTLALVAALGLITPASRASEGEPAQVCVIDGQPIDGPAETNFWGDVYHPHHRQELDACDFCERLLHGDLLDGFTLLPDGRRLCGPHAREVVATQAEANSLLIVVSQRLRDEGLDIRTDDVVVRLAWRDEMDPSADVATTGDADAATGVATTGGQEADAAAPVELTLLRSMPRAQAMAVLARELAHLYKSERSQDLVDPLLCEAFVGYAEYVVVRETGRDGEFIVFSWTRGVDPELRDAFERLRVAAEQDGLAATLRSNY